MSYKCFPSVPMPGSGFLSVLQTTYAVLTRELEKIETDSKLVRKEISL